MINILYVIPFLGLGGAERQLVELVKNINREIYNPFVCCIGLNGELAAEVEEKGIKIFLLGKKRRREALRVIFNIIKLIRENDIDIVHSWMFSAGLYGRIAAKLAKVPVIIYAERGLYRWKKWYHIRLDNFLDGFTDRLIANADAVSRFYADQHNTNLDKWTTIYNGVDKNRFNGDNSEMVIKKIKESLNIPSSSQIVGMIGNLIYSKAHDSLIKAAPQILKAIPDTYFVFVGGAPQSIKKHVPYRTLNEFKCLAENSGCSERIIITGYRDDIPEILSCFDVLVLPSKKSTTEGCPNVILEAMAAQKPVVAAKVSGIPEILINAVNGFLISPESSQELAEKVLVLLKDKSLANEMGRAGEKVLNDRFTVSRMVEETEQLYSTLLKDKTNI